MARIQLFNVAPSVPKKLAFLETLARNMWWCWNEDAIDLFRRISSQVWNESGGSPLVFLSHLSPDRLKELARDEGFLAQLESVKQRFEAETGGCSLDGAQRNCLAYFSLEYGIHESIRTYCGGLGILAGDYMKAASDMNLPMVAVGLMYRQGYFQQYLNQDGRQQESYPEQQIHYLPLQKATSDSRQQLRVSVAMPGERELHAVVWRLDIGRVPLFLLDTNIAENEPEFRTITTRLYGGDREMRLRQELLLGIGGYRALRKLGYDPDACHINEGHAAFMNLARIEDLVQGKGYELETALEIVKHTNVFTTHTPVPAGNEAFRVDMLRPHLEALAPAMGFDTDQVLSWGQPPGADPAGQADNEQEMSMTILSLNLAKYNNGVSEMHGKVERDMWSHLWPPCPVDEIPIGHVTNGVHVPTWLSRDIAGLFDRYLGPDWRTNPSDPEVLEGIDDIPAEELWRAHQAGRSRLVRASRELVKEQYQRRNATPADIETAEGLLRHDALTLGFARRFATYKRGTLLLRDPERLKAMLASEELPVQLVFAGAAHPADEAGKEMIRQILQFARDPDVRKNIVFLENYDMRIARSLVQGCDVWVNTPRRPHEASGTSGMKACLNGCLHASVLDGWWCEGYHPDIGWAIGQGEVYEDTEYQDAVESQALYNILENDIIPRFYDRSEDDIPGEWMGMMKGALRMALERFTTFRMASEYNELYYQQALHDGRRLVDNKAAAARELVDRCNKLKSLWGNVRLEEPEADRDFSMMHVGERFKVTTRVHLGELEPDEVKVQVYYGPVDSRNSITESHAETMTLVEEETEGTYRYEHHINCQSPGRYGFTARVAPDDGSGERIMPEFIKWAEE